MHRPSRAELPVQVGRELRPLDVGDVTRAPARAPGAVLNDHRVQAHAGVVEAPAVTHPQELVRRGPGVGEVDVLVVVAGAGTVDAVVGRRNLGDAEAARVEGAAAVRHVPGAVPVIRARAARVRPVKDSQAGAGGVVGFAGTAVADAIHRRVAGVGHEASDVGGTDAVRRVGADAALIDRPLTVVVRERHVVARVVDDRCGLAKSRPQSAREQCCGEQKQYASERGHRTTPFFLFG